MGNCENLKGIFGSNIKVQEIVLLLSDLKKVVRQGYYKPELKKVLMFCDLMNIKYVISDFKIKPEGKGFVDKGIIDKNGMNLIYFSKNKVLAENAYEYEQKLDHYNLGLILGYPICCVENFITRFSPENTDLSIKSNKFITNLSKRNEDYLLLSHFPCCPDCEESIDLGERYILELSKFDPEHTAKLITKLQEDTNN